MKRKIISILLAGSLILSTSLVAFAEPIPQSQVQTVALSVPDTYEMAAENKAFVLYAEKKTGKIALQIKETGYIWYSNPLGSENDTVAGGDLKKRLDAQVVLYYTQGISEAVTNSVTGCVNRGGLKSQAIENGIKFIYEFKDAGFTVPVQYIIEDDGLRAEVLLQEITPDVVVREQNVSGSSKKIPIDYNITKIDFMQYFGAGASDEDGYMFVPEGSGGIINFNNGKVNALPYQAPIYGQYMDQSSMRNLSNDLVRMPVFGIKKGDNAFVTIIEENEGIGIINGFVSGRQTSYNAVFPTVYRRIVDVAGGDSRSQPLSESLTSKGNFSLKYHFMSGEKANYSEMAKIYQTYLINNKGLRKAKSADKNQLYLNLFASVERRTSVAGFVKNVVEPLTTFEDVEAISKQYIENGITDIAIKYNDWTKNSVRQKVKTDAKLEGKLGSKKDFNNLVKFTDENKIDFYPSVNFSEYSDSKWGYSSVFDASKSPDQSPAYVRAKLSIEGPLGRRWSLLKPNKVAEASVNFLDSYKKTGATGVALDYIAEKVYSDNSKGGIKRSDTVGIWTGVLENSKDIVGKIMVENANAYALPYAEHIISAPTSAYGNELLDDNIPFYQMVLHGMVSYSTPTINLTSDWKDSVLKAVETGSCLNFTFVKENANILKDTYYNNLYSCDFDTWFNKSVNEYKRVDAVLGKVSGKKMISHSQIADNVYETIYEGGIRTIVNYNDESAATAFGEVKAKDFILVN